MFPADFLSKKCIRKFTRLRGTRPARSAGRNETSQRGRACWPQEGQHQSALALLFKDKHKVRCPGQVAVTEKPLVALLVTIDQRKLQNFPPEPKPGPDKLEGAQARGGQGDSRTSSPFPHHRAPGHWQCW